MWWTVSPALRSIFVWLGRTACAIGLIMAMAAGSSSAWAFDLNGYKSRAEATLAELNAKQLPDSKATLARLDEMIAMGIVGVKEFAAHQPKYAKLMNAAIADAQAMKGMTDAQLEEKWGENGSGGDAVGIPLKSLGESSAPRAYLELIVSPAMQYVYIRRWQAVKKVRFLEQATEEMGELHLGSGSMSGSLLGSLQGSNDGAEAASAAAPCERAYSSISGGTSSEPSSTLAT